jgi:hypothetical protein
VYCGLHGYQPIVVTLFERDDNPLLPDERDAFLAKVAKLNGKGFEPDFWSVLLEG